MSTIWTPQIWIERGGETIRQDALLAQRMISHGLKAMPLCGIGWFNLGLAQHKQGKIIGAIRCYRKALALDDSETTPTPRHHQPRSRSFTKRGVDRRVRNL